MVKFIPFFSILSRPYPLFVKNIKSNFFNILRYDIKSLSEKARSEPLEGLPDTVKTSVLSFLSIYFIDKFKLKTNSIVSDLIEEEIGNGIPSNKIMLGGFSQGFSKFMCTKIFTSLY